MTTPEAIARQNIDLQLEECGWIIQGFSEMNFMAGFGVAVRDYQLTTGEANYVLYIDGIVKIVREEFGRDEFCQQITSKSNKPDDLLQSFRNSYNRRIAGIVSSF